MKCRVVQRQLLALDNPHRPPPAAADHLSHCASCRDLLHHLLVLERAVPLIPVPPPTAKAALWSRLQEPPVSVPLRPTPAPVGWRQRQARIMAASVLLILLGGAGLLVWQPWSRQTPPVRVTQPPDPFLANLMQRNLSLARADTPLSRVITLADLADDLQGQANGLATVGATTDLKALAGWFEQVVDKGVVAQARLLPTMQRPTILAPITDRLVAVEREAWRLSQNYPGSGEPLRALGKAARLGYVQLRPLYVEIRNPKHEIRNEIQNPKSEFRRGPFFASLGFGMSDFRLFATAAPQPMTAVVDFTEQVRRFQRNRELIEALVDGGLRLATRASPQERAESCYLVAEQMTGEIRKAAQDRDGPRAAELARHLRAVLENGLAANLSQALSRTRASSPVYRDMVELGRKVVQMVQPLEEELQTGDTDLQRAAQAVTVGRLEVDKVLQLHRPLAEDPS